MWSRLSVELPEQELLYHPVPLHLSVSDEVPDLCGHEKCEENVIQLPCGYCTEPEVLLIDHDEYDDRLEQPPAHMGKKTDLQVSTK